MREWIICKNCSLKYRATESVCPRCESAPADGQARWGDHRASNGPPPRSKAFIVAPIVLLAVGGAGALVTLAPAGFFNPSLQQKIERACAQKQSVDCDCVGKKTSDMMSAEQRAAGFDAEDPSTRELMNTASQLCLKARLVTKCRDAKQGSEFQCICIVNGAVDKLTSEDLEQLFTGGAPPRGYATIRDGCY
jgi:hypothetical protein